MNKPPSFHRHLSPIQHNLSSFLRPAHPQYPPLSSQTPNTISRPQENSLSNQNQYTLMRTLQTSADELVQHQKQIEKQAKSAALDRLAKADYQKASYQKALHYKNERSYKIKKQNQYKQLDLFCDPNELRYFGLGTYFYIQFFRRTMWLFFILTLMNFMSIIINFRGNGLENYSVSFSSYLMKTTLGNYSGPVLSNPFDAYVIIFVPFFNFFALLIFYLVWKVHFVKAVTNQEQDNKDVRPENFCIQIEGLPQEYIRDQEQELFKLFEDSFGKIYEISLVRNYDNKLPYFQQIDQLKQKIYQLKVELDLDPSQKKQKFLDEKQKQLNALKQKLHQISIKPSTVSAFVHFQYEKSKAECLTHFKDQYLFNNFFHCLMRSLCCCCIKKPKKDLVFHNKTLLLSNSYPTHPQDINWASFEIGLCNKIFRAMFAVFIILVFLSASCIIIGLCSVYIQTHSSDCDGIDTSIYTVNSLPNDAIIIRCYCNANIVSSFTDSTIQTTCSDYLKDIYIEQTIQYVIIITSSVTNILFTLISEKLINFVRPELFSAILKYKTAILTLFYTLNSVFIPLLIYANIFGFTPANYVSFFTIIFSDIRNFLKVQSLSFYPNFTSIWYRNVSPIFTNFILFDTVGLWGSYLFFKLCCSRKDSLQNKQNLIIQKTMNNKMTDFKLDVANEAASLYLIIIMTCIFWAGIPVLVPLAFLNIMSRYIINRSLLQNHSVRISGLSEEFNSFSLLVLPAILILFPPLAEWMIVANSYIYPSGLPISFSLSFLQGHSYILDVQLYLPFYLGLSAVALVEIVVYYTLINSIYKICHIFCNVCHKKEIQYHSRPFSEHTKNLNILCSYKIRNNDQMRSTILQLEKYLAHDYK